MDRTTVSSGTEWESRVGYSRAARVGRQVHVAGTTATDVHGDLVGAGDARAQAVQAFENVDRALPEAGASLADVVSTPDVRHGRRPMGGDRPGARGGVR